MIFNTNSGGNEKLKGLIDGSLTSIAIPNGTTKIRTYAFYGLEDLQKVTIPNSVTWIEYSAFSHCFGGFSVDIPSSVIGMGGGVFSPSGIKRATFPGSMDYVPKNTFRESELESLVIQEGVTNIKESAFNTCRSLASVSLPSSLIVIERDAFYGCRSLQGLTIPENVTSIEARAFAGCSALTDLIVKAVTPPTLASSAFAGMPGNVNIYVPANSVDAYKTASGWSSWEQCIQAIPEEVNP